MSGSNVDVIVIGAGSAGAGDGNTNAPSIMIGERAADFMLADA